MVVSLNYFYTSSNIFDKIWTAKPVKKWCRRSRVASSSASNSSIMRRPRQASSSATNPTATSRMKKEIRWPKHNSASCRAARSPNTTDPKAFRSRSRTTRMLHYLIISIWRTRSSKMCSKSTKSTRMIRGETWRHSPKKTTASSGLRTWTSCICRLKTGNS